LTRLFRFATIRVTLIFTAAIMLLRLPPYQDGGLRTLLTPPDNCAAPCWLGVRPGITTLIASGQILKHSAWIRLFQPISPAMAFLHFSRAVPAVERGKLNLWEGSQGTVTQIILFDTGLSFSEIQLALGTPERLFLNRVVQYGIYGKNQLIAIYPRDDVVVTTDFYPCGLDQVSFWNQPNKLMVTIGDWRNAVNNPRVAYYVSSVELDPGRWATQLRQMQLCTP
jgi:hypothetical protein